MKEQRGISAEKGERFCTKCKKSKKLIDFSKTGCYCKACLQNYKSEYRKKRKTLSDSELRENKCAKKDISNSLKCSDCSVFNQDN